MMRVIETPKSRRTMQTGSVSFYRYLERYIEPNVLDVSPVEQKLKLPPSTILPPVNDEMVKMDVYFLK
jgi:hypothetical protein